MRKREGWFCCAAAAFREVSFALLCHGVWRLSLAVPLGFALEALLSHQSVLQECQEESSTRVPCKTAPQECPTRVCYKTAREECPTRVSRVSFKSVAQECPTE